MTTFGNYPNRFAVDYDNAPHYQYIPFAKVAELLVQYGAVNHCAIRVWDILTRETLVYIPAQNPDHSGIETMARAFCSAGQAWDLDGTYDCGHCHYSSAQLADDGRILCNIGNCHLTAGCAGCRVGWESGRSGRHHCRTYQDSGRVLVPHEEMTASGRLIRELRTVEHAAPTHRNGFCDLGAPRVVRIGRTRGKRPAGSLTADARERIAYHRACTTLAALCGPAMCRQNSRFPRSPRVRVVYRKRAHSGILSPVRVTFRRSQSTDRVVRFGTFRYLYSGATTRHFRKSVTLLSGAPAVYCQDCGTRLTASAQVIRHWERNDLPDFAGCGECLRKRGYAYVSCHSPHRWESGYLREVGFYQ
jgi:hypothetical protein